MSKYGFRDNKQKAEKVTTDELIGPEGIVSIGPLAVTADTIWYLDFPVKVDVDKVAVVCSTAIDATCNVAAKNATGTFMTDGSFNFDPSGVIGDSESVTPTANNEIAADASMQIVADPDAAVTTGAIYAVVHYTRKA